MSTNIGRLRVGAHAETGDSLRWTMCTILQSGRKIEPSILTIGELSNRVSKQQDLIVQGCLCDGCQRLLLSGETVSRELLTIANRLQYKEKDCR